MSPLSVSQLVLRARQLETDAVRHLAGRVELTDVVGQLVHALQRERGASSIFVASGGQRFQLERDAAMHEAQAVEGTLRALFAKQAAPEHGASARMLSLMAWVLLDLESLAALRARVTQHGLSAHDTVAAFSRVIAGQVELIFHVADAAQYPGISRQLVALVHLLQGKEAAGQERAVGAQLFASGVSDEAEQQRVIHLIDAQERSLKVFEAFAAPAWLQRWQQHQLTPTVALLERLRRTLCTAHAGGALDTSLSDSWFKVTSERITEMWACQEAMVQDLRLACEAQWQASAQDLQDTEGLLRQLRDNPPPHTHAVDRFFNSTAGTDARVDLPTLPAMTHEPQAGAADEQARVASMAELLQAQSARLASMEVELDAARRALHERKVIERAKGALMSRLGLSEEAAFRALQKASMDHNRRLLDVAEATLSLPDHFFAAKPVPTSPSKQKG